MRFDVYLPIEMPADLVGELLTGLSDGWTLTVCDSDSPVLRYEVQ